MDRNAFENRTARRILGMAGAVLAVAVAVAQPQSAQADPITPPPVPAKLQVPAGSVAFLEGHALGTQNYVCLPSGSGFAWQHSRDTSTVWAKVALDGSSTDPAFVAAGAIPWLLLDVVGVQEGPSGGD